MKELKQLSEVFQSRMRQEMHSFQFPNTSNCTYSFFLDSFSNYTQQRSAAEEQELPFIS